MKNKIICLVLSLVFVAGVFGLNGTYAWFLTYGEGAGGVLHNFQSGKLGYTLVGSFIEDGKIEPVQNLIATGTDFHLINNSNIDTQVRVKVIYTYFVKEVENNQEVDKCVGQSLVSTSDTGAPFVAELATDANSKTYWTYNDADNYFYYDDPYTEDDSTTSDINEDVNVIKGVTEDEGQTVIPVFSKLYYSGDYSDLPTSLFSLANNVFSVKVVFEAKQADYVTWEVMGEVTFETVPDVKETTTVQAS